MAILVTGAAGFLGKSVASRLSQDGHSVVATDVTKSTADILQCDMRDSTAVDHLIDRIRPSHIVHCGAISGPALARDNPRLVFEVNTAGTWNLLNAGMRQGVRRFVLLSSICAYGPLRSRDVVREDQWLMATDPYGASKICAERCVASYARAFELGAASLRMSSVYGPGRQTACTIQALVNSAWGGPPADLYNGGEAPRQLVHITDATNAVVRAVSVDHFTQLAYNISGGTFTPELEIAKQVQRVLPSARFAILSEGGDFPDSDMGKMDISAARRDFGYLPVIPFEDGLADYIDHLTNTR